MKTVVMIWTMLVPLLLLWWILQRLWRQPGWTGAVVSGAVSLALVLFPWFGHWLPYWSASLSANFSVPMAVLLGAGILGCARQVEIFRLRDWQAAWVFGAAASLVLYPSALGLGPQNFDAYALGWPWLFWSSSLALFGGVGLTAAVLILRGNRFGYVLLLALAAYSTGFQESTNLWDYLLDPVFGAVSLLSVLWWLGRRAIPESRSKGLSGKADR